MEPRKSALQFDGKKFNLGVSNLIWLAEKIIWELELILLLKV